jgi:hypothetical protein
VVEEDLAAAVAGTTREPAAAEGATAWEVADIAVVVAEDAAAADVVVAAADVAAAAGGVDKINSMRKHK